MGELSAAVESLRHVTDLEASHSTANRRLAECYLRLSEFERAAQCLELVLARDPKDSAALVNLSLARQNLGDFPAAAQLLWQAIANDPSSVDAKNNLAWLLATAPDESVRDSRQAVRLAVEAAEAVQYRDPNVLDTLSAAYAADGQTALAIHWLERCLEASPDVRRDELQSRLEQLRATPVN